MASSANVTSIDAIRQIRLALQQFQTDAQNALMQLELEGRRPVAWIDGDRAPYWEREVRKASDRLSEARIALEKAEVTTSAEETKYAYDERKALEKAKRRLRLCEEKIQKVKRWRSVIHKETEVFQAQLAKLQRYLEHDLTQSIAALGRMAEALDRYIRLESAGTTAPAAGPVPQGDAP
jgi:chromosome segregation ATPase